MKISYTLNGRQYTDEVSPAQPLTEYLRSKGCLSVKRGCETSNCGLCTVLVNRKPVLSCSTLTARIDGKTVETLEGLQKEAEEIGGYLAGEGAEQCGFCSPGLIMNIIGMLRELKSPTEEEIRNYLAGNLCRCTGYVGQLRAIQKYLAEKEEA
ncbi:MAG: (2Fe-2S)-binding protein [Butyricicoccus sp.]|nr:(2Fe-2S)-binding protein [Butyricicoccus pullicaecorum]